MVVYQKCIQVCFCEFRNDMSDGILNLSQKIPNITQRRKTEWKNKQYQLLYNVHFCIMHTFV